MLTKIIRREDAERQLTLKAANEQAAASIEKAMEDGFQNGIELGLQALREAADRLNRLAEARQIRLEASVTYIVERALYMIVDHLSKEELAVACARRAIADYATEARLKLLVSSQERKPVIDALSALVRSSGREMDLGLDPLLESGEIVVESGAERTHIGWKHQFDHVKRALECNR